jgi:hypothetical protein
MNKEQFRKFINTITDMSKIYANIIVAGGGVIMSQVGTARQVSINREVDDRNRSHDLEHEMSNDTHIKRYDQWKLKLNSADPFELGKHNSNLEQKESDALLRYYLKRPCMDYLELNYKGDGCDVVFSNQSSDVIFLNKLLETCLGSISTMQNENDKKSACASHLQNYETLCAQIVCNASKKNSNGKKGGGASEYKNALLSHRDILALCVKCTADTPFCETIFPAISEDVYLEDFLYTINNNYN